MANTTAADWDESSPANSDIVGEGAREIRNLRASVADRLLKEHVVPAGSTAGGQHLEGSARIYVGAANPTLKPDAATALDADDEGRMCSTKKKLRIYSGSAFFDARADAPIAILEDRANSGSDGGSSSAATWHTRVLDTEYDPESIVSHNTGTGVMTLANGTYRIRAWSVGYAVGTHQIRLRRTSGTPATIAVGSSEYSPTGDQAAGSRSELSVEFTNAAGNSTYELQHYTQLAKSTDGLGRAVASGETNRYALVEIQQVNE
jgi:hypothetical protein